jgi:ligand-binding sensor domain-containing protein
MLRISFFVVLCAVVLGLSFGGAVAQNGIVRGLDPTKPISEYRHRVWTANTGLPQNSPQALCQTRDGYLWIATQEGLVRFDGLNFKAFDKTNTPAILDNYIITLLETNSGVLWGGGFNGCLFSMQNDIFKRYEINPTIEVRTLCEWHESVWIGTNQGLYILQNGTTTAQKIKIQEDLPNNGIFSLAVDSVHHILWVGTQHGLYGLQMNAHSTKDTHTQIFHLHDGLVDEAIRSLLVDSQYNVWIGSQGGLQRGIWQNGHLKIIETFTEQNGLSDNVISALYEDTEHTLWIGTATNGIMRKTTLSKAFETYQKKDGLSGNIVYDIIQLKLRLLKNHKSVNCFPPPVIHII